MYSGILNVFLIPTLQFLNFLSFFPGKKKKRSLLAFFNKKQIPYHMQKSSRLRKREYFFLIFRKNIDREGEKL